MISRRGFLGALLAATLLASSAAHATVTFLTSAVSWTVPAGVSTVTLAECIGGGASGGSSPNQPGGGGGGYGNKANLAVSGSVTVSVTSGTNSNCTFVDASTVKGTGGAGPIGGNGGIGGGGVGDVTHTGGNGGSAGASGGGGAAGPNGDGTVGVSAGSGNGGRADGTSGGLGGTCGTGTANGHAGTEYDGTHGSGGGGGGSGCDSTINFRGGDGGLYGGAGAGDDGSDDGAGSGTGGLIVLTYTATVGGQKILLMNVGGLVDPGHDVWMSASDIRARGWLGWMPADVANDARLPRKVAGE